jgi:membrane fusion protein, copper/silver efflux system
MWGSIIPAGSGRGRWYCARWLACLLLILPMLARGGETMPGLSVNHPGGHQDETYVCPMHPQVVRDEPGSCPICGMALVRKTLDATPGKYPEVRLIPSVVQTMGVRIAAVERGRLSQQIRTFGRVDYDETRLAHLHPRADGFIQGLTLRAEGEAVRKGQELAQLYSPVILSAQVDFLLALQPDAKDGPARKLDKARNILRLLDVPEPVIREIEQRHETRQTIPVLAPFDGVVTAIAARQGMFVAESTDMFTIADLSRIWVIADIYEGQIDWLAPGSGATAEIKVPALPGRIWNGTVDYIYPALDPKSRTLRVRLVFDNPGQTLKPNMFTNVVIDGGFTRDVLKIPSEALILTGEREAVVRALGDGHFQPVDVTTGIQSGGWVEITSGLSEGDEVVVSGQFLIDSESSLQASFRRLEGVSGPAAGRPESSVGGGHVHP